MTESPYDTLLRTCPRRDCTEGCQPNMRSAKILASVDIPSYGQKNGRLPRGRRQQPAPGHSYTGDRQPPICSGAHALHFPTSPKGQEQAPTQMAWDPGFVEIHLLMQEALTSTFSLRLEFKSARRNTQQPFYLCEEKNRAALFTVRVLQDTVLASFQALLTFSIIRASFSLLLAE